MRIIYFFILTSLTIGCNQDAQTTQSQNSEQIEIDVKMYSELWGKFLSGDTDVINNTTFTEDVVVVTELGDIVGIDAVKEFYLNYLYGFLRLILKL